MSDNIYIRADGLELADQPAPGSETTRWIVEFDGCTREHAREVLQRMVADDDCHLGLMMDEVTGTTYGSMKLIGEVNWR